MDELDGLAAETDAAALPLYAVRPDALPDFLQELAAPHRAFLQAQGFAAAAGALTLLPRHSGTDRSEIDRSEIDRSGIGRSGIEGAVLGLGEDRSPHAFGGSANALPEASLWRIVPGDFDAQDAALGFLLGAYSYRRFKNKPVRPPARLLASQVTPRTRQVVAAVTLARDLINEPPNFLGPAELAARVAAEAAAFGAICETIGGLALAARFPALHAVGAGSARAPAAVVLRWSGSGAGPAAKTISLCGKGVCFDTGGYDLKPSAAMLRMKKDMGGAAIMLGLARLIMALDLPLHLTLRIGCVENSVSGHAMRPSDVLTTHAGKTVEIGNTDAEGRLVLCDLLSEAAAERPDWLLDAATLTGAARVALGPDLPALFCSDEDMAARILAAGQRVHDPLWRLPLFAGYENWLDSSVADMNNVSAKPHAGAIVAALFLQRFVTQGVAWAHVDVYAWNDQSRPGRPEGGEAQTLRAIFAAIEGLRGESART